MALKYSILRIHTNFKTIKNVIGRMEKKPPNFLTYLFGVTPPVRCYPLLRYGSGSIGPGFTTTVSDPYSFNTDPDPAFRQNTDPDQDPIRIQGFDDQKLEKIYSWKKFFFRSKTTVYLSLGLHKGRPSNRRSLQLSKENIRHFKIWNFLIFSTFVGHFCPPGSGSGLRTRI